jgi:secondary thiamine-phosphate synthase enzyme
MPRQTLFTVATGGRGFLDLTERVARLVRETAPELTGLAHLFARHTSCGLLITENASPEVRTDLETLARRFAPDGDPAYAHDLEGPDDMAAHGRALLAGPSLFVPVAQGRLLLGTWQGIFLWEHRTRPHRRELVLTLLP